MQLCLERPVPFRQRKGYDDGRIPGIWCFALLTGLCPLALRIRNPHSRHARPLFPVRLSAVRFNQGTSLTAVKTPPGTLRLPVLRHRHCQGCCGWSSWFQSNTSVLSWPWVIVYCDLDDLKPCNDQSRVMTSCVLGARYWARSFANRIFSDV